MPSLAVVEDLDVVEDRVRQLDPGIPLLAVRSSIKDAPPAELFAGIRATARGETVLAPSVAATFVRCTTGASAVTEREVQVLELLSRGLGNREIARELFVSEATVTSHLSHVYTKLGVDTRAGAAAVERRIIRS
jgi:DNA-binding NarL/FixJ family response regulator